MDAGGPYLNAALLCEKVLQERDGVLSIIRIIDRAQHVWSIEELVRLLAEKAKGAVA
jgi:hypothetical protein